MKPYCLFPNFPELQTARCRLVQPRTEHAPNMLEIFGDAETMRYMQSSPVTQVEDCHRKVDAWQRDLETGKGIRWAVVPKEAPEELVGVFALHYWSQVHQRAELGSYLHRDWWGRGLSTELTRAVLHFAFLRAELHRVELRCDPRNSASVAIARKFGMRLEGVLRDYVFVEERGFVDEAVYALLSTDWPASPWGGF